MGSGISSKKTIANDEANNSSIKTTSKAQQNEIIPNTNNSVKSKASEIEQLTNKKNIEESIEVFKCNENLINVAENDVKDFYDEDNIENESMQDDSSDAANEILANAALSLGMDNDDLLFNLMYFEEQVSAVSFGSLLNTVQSETVALHSENNTPYKLKPASESSIADLKHELFNSSTDLTSDKECAVCKDEIEDGSEIIRLPLCKHIFHQECLLKWVKLQGWCPICRTNLTHVVSIDRSTPMNILERIDEKNSTHNSNNTNNINSNNNIKSSARILFNDDASDAESITNDENYCYDFKNYDDDGAYCNDSNEDDNEENFINEMILANKKHDEYSLNEEKLSPQNSYAKKNMELLDLSDSNNELINVHEKNEKSSLQNKVVKPMEKITSEPKIKFFADNSKKFHSATTIDDSDSCCYPFEQVADTSNHDMHERKQEK